MFTAKSGVGGIPKEQDGVKIVAQVTGPINALGRASAPVLIPSTQSTTDRWDRPVPIGVSTGHPAITAGTFGSRVKDSNGTIYALTNNHVYANENLANIGDEVIQPGTYDGGSAPADTIGTLFAFKDIVFPILANNKIDAAIALSSLGDLGNTTPSDGYGTPKSEIVSATLNLKVQKYGRTTGLTTNGRITGINATLNIGYDSGTARFVDQIIVESRKPRYLQGGDSGSLLVVEGGADDRKPVGLLFVGTSTGKMSIANRIDLVLEEFGVMIDGEGSAPSPTPTPDPTATPDPDATPTPTPDPTATPTPTSTPPPSSGDIGVYDISWKSKKRNLDFTINIRQDSDGDGTLTSTDSLVEAAHVNATLTHDSNGNGVIEDCSIDTCYSNFGGDTGSNGSVKFSLVGGAPMGLYQAEVTGLTHATRVWNTALDADNPDAFTR